MSHKRVLRHPYRLDDNLELDLNPDNLIFDDYIDDDDDEDFYGSPKTKVRDSTWKDDLNYQWKTFTKFIYKNRRSSAVTTLTLMLLLILRYLLNNIKIESEDQTLNFDDSFTFESEMTSPLHQIILPTYEDIYPEKAPLHGEKVVELFDFRFTSSLMLLYFQNIMRVNKNTLPMNLKIPFSWHDWIDFDERLKFDDNYLVEWLAYHSDNFQPKIKDFKSLDCQTFCVLYGCEGSTNFMNVCKPQVPDDKYPYKFQIDRFIDTKIKEPGRALLSASYLYHHMPNPKRLYLLGLGDKNVVLQVDESYNERDNFLTSNSMVRKLMEFNAKLTKMNPEDNWIKGWNMAQHRNRTEVILNAESRKASEIYITSPDQRLRNDRSRIINLDNVKKGMKVDHWNFENFVWDEFKFLDTLMHSALSHSGLDQTLFDNLIDVEQHRIETGSHPKYLHEANLYETGLGSHYDWRFFQTSLILNDFRQSIIHRLARTWLRFCFQNGFQTFIAYGSMLGWMDNGLTLPWDSDIDAVVTMESLSRLARDFNQTLIIDYTAKDGLQSAMTGYLIDINPTYYSRIKGDGNNAIDGRLIDISTGMYLDITALAWTENYLSEVELNDKIKKLIDKDYKTNHIFALEGGGRYEDILLRQLKELQDNRKLVHCKNNMVYKIEELETMVPSYFEGARGHFPSMYENILLRFYPDMQKRTFNHHDYKEYLRLWVPWDQCNDKDDEDGKLCEDEAIRREFRLTRDYTQRHVNILPHLADPDLTLDVESESRPLRIDEFFLWYGDWLGLSMDEIEQIYLN